MSPWIDQPDLYCGDQKYSSRPHQWVERLWRLIAVGMFDSYLMCSQISDSVEVIAEESALVPGGNMLN